MRHVLRESAALASLFLSLTGVQGVCNRKSYEKEKKGLSRSRFLGKVELDVSQRDSQEMPSIFHRKKFQGT